MPPATKACPRCQTPLQFLDGSPEKWRCSACKARFVDRTKAEPAGTPSKPSARLLSTQWLPLLLIPAVGFVGFSIILVVHFSRSASKQEAVAVLPFENRSSATNDAEVNSRLLRPEEAENEPPKMNRPTIHGHPNQGPPRNPWLSFKNQPPGLQGSPLSPWQASEDRPPALPRPSPGKPPRLPERTAEVAKEESVSATSSVPPGLARQINAAIDKGVTFLKPEVDKIPGHKYGYSALAALTLLECGVPAADPILAKVIAHVRKGLPRFDTTYTVSVAVLLLDRLDREEDEPLIRTLALQLIAAQNAAGGWHYGAPQLTAEQQKELHALLVSESEASDSDSALAKLPAVRFQTGQQAQIKISADDDNSNTQFAALALWVARKHGIPADRPLGLVGARFRALQNRQGAWGYKRSGSYFHRDSMTCAGLLGLAVERAVTNAKGRQVDDPAVSKAQAFLGRTLRRAAARPIINPSLRLKRPVGEDYRPVKAESDGDLYYLWSLERVAFLYDWQKVARVDWYGWGAQLLVSVQNADGSWSDRWGQQVGTCFALLFLKRVNFAKDLTKRLKQLEFLGKQEQGVSPGEISKGKKDGPNVGIAPSPPSSPSSPDLSPREIKKKPIPAPPSTPQPKKP